MKIKKTKPIIYGIEFDSLDEVLFYRWLKEAKQAEFIKDFQKCDTFTLSDKVMKINAKNKEVMLQKDITYTPDFKLFFVPQNKATEFSKSIDMPINYRGNGILFIDVKGSSQKNMRSKSTSATTFPIKRAWLYQKTGIWVHKVLVDEWFKLTWCPAAPEVFSQNPKLCYSRFDGMKLNNGSVLKSKETAMNEVIILENFANDSIFPLSKNQINDIFLFENKTVVEYFVINGKREKEKNALGKDFLYKKFVKETPQQVQEMMYDVVKFNEKRRK